MVVPVPGYGVGTPYGKRGPYWSCDEDAAGNGIHTGVDYAAPAGTAVVAARPGRVVYSSHGSAFGNHQIDITPGDGTRDFYAHMRTRAVGNGEQVEAGQKIGEVGTEGNVTGAHLHFERHATDSGGWSCSVVRDPAPSINWEDPDEMNSEDWKKLRGIVADEVAQNNAPAAEAVWKRDITTTEPDGSETVKDSAVVVRQTYQKVSRLDAGGKSVAGMSRELWALALVCVVIVAGFFLAVFVAIDRSP